MIFVLAAPGPLVSGSFEKLSVLLGVHVRCVTVIDLARTVYIHHPAIITVYTLYMYTIYKGQPR